MRLKHWIIVVLSLTVLNSWSQKTEFCDCFNFDLPRDTIANINPSEATPCISLGSGPKFPGGEKRLFKFIKSHSRFIVLSDDNIELPYIEQVFVCLEIDNSGNITEKKVRGSQEKYKHDALNLIDLMPKWIPSNTLDRNINGFYTFRIVYLKE